MLGVTITIFYADDVFQPFFWIVGYWPFCAPLYNHLISKFFG